MSSTPDNCPICNQEVPGDASQLEQHVNDHLDKGEEELSRKVAQQLADESLADGRTKPPPQASAEVNEPIGPAERMILEVEQNDAALASALAHAEGAHPASANALAPTLRGSLTDSAEQFYPNVLRRVLPLYDSFELLSRKRVHICSKIDIFSSNIAGMGWDCGYRNIQMLFSALLYDPECAAQLKAAGIAEVPSVPEIAGRIEEAWKNGFDPEGAANFAGSLTDKDVWIGATEAFVLFRSMSMNAYVTDFETPTQKDKRNMFEWIYKHFEQCCHGRSCSIHRRSLLSSNKSGLVSPIFCQWQGHSVTIIGAERSRSGEILLVVLDPSRGFYTSLMSEGHSRVTLIRRETNHPQLAQPRFQFVSVLPKRCAEMATGRENRRGMLGKLRLGGPS